MPGSRQITNKEEGKSHESLLKKVLELTAVTSVSSTDDSFATNLSSSAVGGDNANRMIDWNNFHIKVKDLNTKLNWISVRSTMTSAALGRDDINVCGGSVGIKISCKSSSATSVESLDNNYLAFFEWLKSHLKQYFKKMGSVPIFQVDAEAAQISIRFSSPSETSPPRKDVSTVPLLENHDNYLSWITKKRPLIEETMIKARDDYDSVSDNISETGDYKNSKEEISMVESGGGPQSTNETNKKSLSVSEVGQHPGGNEN